MKNTLLCLGLLLMTICWTGCIVDEQDLASQDCGNVCAVLRGQLTTNNGYSPIQNARLEAFWEHDPTFGRTTRLKAQAVTDNSGFYELKFQLREDELERGNHIVKIHTSEEYIQCEDTYNEFILRNLTNDSVITTNYMIPRIAYIKISALGTENMIDRDLLTVRVDHYPEAQNPIPCDSPNTSWIASHPDGELDAEVFANESLVVRINKRKNDIFTTTYDTVYVELGETLEYTVTFD